MQIDADKEATEGIERSAGLSKFHRRLQVGLVLGPSFETRMRLVRLPSADYKSLICVHLRQSAVRLFVFCFRVNWRPFAVGISCFVIFP